MSTRGGRAEIGRRAVEVHLGNVVATEGEQPVFPLLGDFTVADVKASLRESGVVVR